MSQKILSHRLLKEVTDPEHPDYVPPDIIPEYEGEYMVLGADDDYYDDAYEDDTFYLPDWALMVGVIILSSLMVGAIFYLSYRHELLKKEKRNMPTAETDEGDVAKVEEGLSVRKYGDEQSVATMSCGSSSDSDSFVSRSTTTSVAASTNTCSSTKSKLVQLFTEHRCVLCSKAFEDGDDVAHSDQCHHEFHQACLTKHWATKCSQKNKNESDLHGRCPICKESFTTTMTA